MLSVFFGLSLWCVASGQNVSEFCRHHSPFSHPEKRLVTNKNHDWLDDRYIREGWYGKIEHIIPTEPPGAGHCGAKYPIYLQDRPSNSGDVQNITACIQADIECQDTITIQAVVCSATLTVYNLARPSLNYASYCLAPSIEGEFPDFKTKTKITHKIQDVPVPENPNTTRKEYEFTCSFDNPEDVKLVFKTQWFVDDRSVYDSPFTNYDDEDRVRTLTDTRLNASGITTAGFQLRCEIRPGFISQQTLIPGLPSRSPTKFIGIEVLNSVVNIGEGETALIFFKPSLEIGCRPSDENQDGTCTLSVTADIPEDNEAKCQPTPVANGNCGVNMDVKKWNSYWANYINISSTATEDFGQDLIQKKIFLRTNKLYISQPLWANNFLTPVTINIQKNTTLIEWRGCSIYNDPYIRDFTKRKLTLQTDGVFTLFRSQGNVEIQVQVTDCSGLNTGYCVCGVVVRVGRTAFMINRCNLGFWYIDYILCDDGADILDVKKRGETSFQIYLPSGTKIYINLRNGAKLSWLNIHMYPSIRDVGKTSGLCNELTITINKNKNLMEDTEFFNKWRVKKEQNLFIPEDYGSIEGIDRAGTFQHCQCDATGKPSDKLDCTPVSGTKSCVQETDYTMFHKKRCISPLRKKRSVPTYFQPNIIRHKRLKRDVSWKNGWTLKRADEYCTNLFNNSKSIERCEGIKGLDIGIAIKTCLNDIQLSGTEAFALSSISTVAAQCLNEAKMNRTLRQETVKEGKSILELVKEVSCPGECSDQGRCEQGKCICNAGYISSDCSLSLNQPPLAHNQDADGHCDLSEDDCSEVAVFGGRFVDHDQTKCKLIPYEIKNDQMVVSDDVVVKTAVFESIGEVTCKLPSRKRKRSIDVPVIDETVTGYKVSVSNNGKSYSQQLNLIIYNTECMNCTMDTDGVQLCFFESEYCIMNNECYKNGSVFNNGRDEYICNADEDSKSWEIISKPDKKTYYDPSCLFTPYSFLYFLLC